MEVLTAAGSFEPQLGRVFITGCLRAESSLGPCLSLAVGEPCPWCGLKGQARPSAVRGSQA